MYKIVYISPATHNKLAVLKDVGLIESISGFVENAINKAIKEIRKKNKEDKKMNSKKLNMDDFITDVEDFKYTKGEMYYVNRFGETLAPHAFKVLYKKGFINKNEWQLIEVE